MARVRVQMYATVREAAATAEVELQASTVGELLEVLGRMFGRGMEEITAHAEEGSEGLVVLLNGRNVMLVGGKDQRLSDGDEVAIFPPVSGG